MRNSIITLAVVLGAFIPLHAQMAYDALRIVVRDNITVNSLSMRSDQDTLLQVQGLSSFNQVWVPVNADWIYAATLGGATASGLASWRFKPTDTGTGIVVVSMGASVPDTIAVRILPGLPNAVVFYNSELSPGPGVARLADPSQVILISAGSPYLLVAKVFDWKGVWLSQYQLSNLQNNISLGAEDPAGNLNSTLDGLVGAVRHFTPAKAYDTVTIIDTLRADAYRLFMDTVRFAVIPGPEKRLVIEPKGPINLTRSNELDTLRLLANEQSKSVYSTVRDAFGNFIRYADVSLWESFDAAIVTVQKGDNLFGEGIAGRNPAAINSTTLIRAVDVNNTLKDTCVFNLMKFYYTDLRIVIGNNTDPADLVMNTNQDTTLRVQGMRSTDSVWVDVPATWQASANLKITPVAPVNNSWRFSPSDTGAGWVRVTLNNDVVTKPDTLPVRFFPGPPVRASIEIITPAPEIIAGRPIQAVVSAYDKDGNGYSYTFDPAVSSNAAYHDALGTGGLSFPEPFIIIDNDTVKLYGTPWENGKQTFVNGRDTVSLTLYYAPSDTPHQISTDLIAGSTAIRAVSAPFVLHPDNLSAIRIEYANGIPVSDTVNLTGSITVYSRGYDKYGNKIGDVTGNWTTTDSLHAVARPDSQSGIFYDAGNVTANEAGYLIVDHAGTRDSVYITINGPLIRLVRAVTRDTSGNGILDRIELEFSRKFKLPANAWFAGLIVAYNGDTLAVAKIENTGNGMDDSVWVLQLIESHSDKPQTGWTPMIQLPLQSAYGLAPAEKHLAADGAGPVIWRVVKHTGSLNPGVYDTVSIQFSERIVNSSGSRISIATRPDSVFKVWLLSNNNGATTFTSSDTMLKGIDYLQRVPDDSTMVFIMSNGMVLSGSYYVSINPASVFDQSDQHNAPDMNNMRVRVMTVGNFNSTILIAGPGNLSATDLSVLKGYPLTITPTGDREPPGEFQAQNNPNARNWVRNDNAGAIFTMDIPATDSKVSLHIGIINESGDEILGATNTDLFSGVPAQTAADIGAIVVFDFYWNGYDKHGKTLKGGKYKVTARLDYVNPSQPVQTAAASFEIPGGADSRHCGCGAGTGLAFFPPIVFKLGSWRRKKRKKTMAF